jgi:hypothetical protein
VVRSLFGTLQLDSPRLRRCACQPADNSRSSSPLAEHLPERTTPERRYLEAKWAALLPFGVTVDVLEEVLPLQANRATVYRHTQQVAERLESELGDEQPFFIEGCQPDWDALPRPDGPLTVGIDGGYIQARDGDNHKAGWFELIVGKSVPTDGDAKCFGFVTSYDTKPKRRLAELLKTQGLQMNQSTTFLSDGGDNVRDLQVNQVISKRFVKKQQMRWTKKGGHLLLQVRAQVLNEDLRPTFERWYPAMTSTDVSAARAA